MPFGKRQLIMEIKDASGAHARVVHNGSVIRLEAFIDGPPQFCQWHPLGEDQAYTVENIRGAVDALCALALEHTFGQFGDDDLKELTDNADEAK